MVCSPMPLGPEVVTTAVEVTGGGSTTFGGEAGVAPLLLGDPAATTVFSKCTRLKVSIDGL